MKKFLATFSDRNVHGYVIGTGCGNLREILYNRFQNEYRKSVTRKKQKAYESPNSPAGETYDEEKQEESMKNLIIEHTLYEHAQNK